MIMPIRHFRDGFRVEFGRVGRDGFVDRERGSRRPSRRSAMSRSAARALAGRDRTSLYQEITDKIITELEGGRVPWVQPWGTAAARAPLDPGLTF
jgi:antirestriction factor ArdC-like protein